MHVTINTANVVNCDISITSEAAEAVRMSFNPSTRPDVDQLKALAAAFISKCDQVLASTRPDAARELATAKTHMQTASMWAVLGATKGL